MLDTLISAMNDAIAAMESDGSCDTRGVIESAAAFQTAVHALSREVSSDSMAEERKRRHGYFHVEETKFGSG
ncbi:hypothetical protein ERJ75_000054000 [Trypanosoma vivax]|nr:hypothetical protein ERJ75_000054000 [Trypanosoma vivax]